MLCKTYSIFSWISLVKLIKLTAVLIEQQLDTLHLLKKGCLWCTFDNEYERLRDIFHMREKK